ncbi:helix-turn-helix transcriptional regulator [Actinocorallia lasiicapitis]
MNITDPPDPKLNLWAAMANYVRFFRMRHGQSGDHVAQLLSCSRSSISRLETGDGKLNENQAAILDHAWNTGGLFGILLHFARLGHDPNWLKNYREYESKATVIRMYDGQTIPAVLQTPDYARALLIAGRERDPDKGVESRMARRQILTRERPAEIWALLAETVLAPEVGGPDVMRAQLAHLLELSRLPNVILRIVSNKAGANEGLDGPFKVITTRADEIGFIEAPVGGRLELDATMVAAMRSRFDRIGAVALPIDSSRQLIQRLMENMR